MNDIPKPPVFAFWFILMVLLACGGLACGLSLQSGEPVDLGVLCGLFIAGAVGAFARLVGIL